MMIKCSIHFFIERCSDYSEMTPALRAFCLRFINSTEHKQNALHSMYIILHCLISEKKVSLGQTALLYFLQTQVRKLSRLPKISLSKHNQLDVMRDISNS